MEHIIKKKKDVKNLFLLAMYKQVLELEHLFFGGEHDSVINSFKKVYKVKSKSQVFEALINDLIEN